MPALQRSPCLVAFSGGRDSSAVLAAATIVARREGLPLPVPVTLRYRAVAETDESRWQDLVLRHLGLEDRVCIDADSELELLGAHSRSLLLRHGLMLPPQLGSWVPMFQHALGGALLDGGWGDAVFGGWRYAELAASAMWTSKRRMAKAQLHARSPRVLRAAWHYWRDDEPALPWLTKAAKRRLMAAVAIEHAGVATRWEPFTRAWAAARFVRVARRSYEAVAGEFDCLSVDPFVEPRFLTALSEARSRWGYGNRTDLMAALFGDVLPPATISRSDKADFTTALWGPTVRAFTESWDGRGVSEQWVDPAALRREWAQPVPDFRTSLLVQAAWLHVTGRKTPIWP